MDPIQKLVNSRGRQFLQLQARRGHHTLEGGEESEADGNGAGWGWGGGDGLGFDDPRDVGQAQPGLGSSLREDRETLGVKGLADWRCGGCGGQEELMGWEEEDTAARTGRAVARHSEGICLCSGLSDVNGHQNRLLKHKWLGPPLLPLAGCLQLLVQ